MNQNAKVILVLSIVILAIAGLLIFSRLSEWVPENDITVTGNTAGNLNNNGLFCESEDVVYFANAYDNYTLYSMGSDETQLKKLNNTSTYSINAGGNYLYYGMSSIGGGSDLSNIIRTSGLYRSKKNGKNTTTLKKDSVLTAQLCGNDIYYQNYNNKDYTQLFCMKTDKSSDTMIADYVINPASYDNGIIYFNGTVDNHYLYTLNTATNEIAVLWEYDIWNPIYYNGFIYFMDIHENYRLCRYSMSANLIEVLTSDRVDYFNIGGYYIYYQKSDAESPALKRMQLDGSDVSIVAEGNYENINITSTYVYFNEFGHSTPVYRTPAFDSVNVTEFSAASDAANANRKKK